MPAPASMKVRPRKIRRGSSAQALTAAAASGGPRNLVRTGLATRASVSDAVRLIQPPTPTCQPLSSGPRPRRHARYYDVVSSRPVAPGVTLDGALTPVSTFAEHGLRTSSTQHHLSAHAMPDLVDGSHYETSAFSGSRHELPGDESVPMTRRLLASGSVAVYQRSVACRCWDRRQLEAGGREPP